jgi:glutamyl-tRNA synthetase
LHLGNARSFLIAWLSVRAQGGTVVLRMEDLDHPKVKQGASEQALEDLRWLGLDWDEGSDVGGPHVPYTQSGRSENYRTALDRLLEQNLAYPCTCSRKDVESAQSAPHAGEGDIRYPGMCRERWISYKEAATILTPPRIPAWRFRTPVGETSFDDAFWGEQRQDVWETVGDFVLGRHPDGAGYMLAVVVDDAAMGITEVIRGDDLMTPTHRQLLLYKSLDLPIPSFAHVPLVIGEDGRRLAKRHGDTRIAALREQGESARKTLGLLAWWCGWAEWGEELSAGELIDRYDLSSIPREPVVLTERVKEYLGVGALK